jgi:predicted RND superfamily exporter protein
MVRETIRFLLLTIALIGAALVMLFRRFSGLCIPLLVVVSCLATTLGLMGWTGASIKLPSIILPSFILAVGVSDAVHILSRFYANLGRGAEKREALSRALDHSGRAVLLTSLTTAAGFFSLAGSDLVPIAEVGIFAGLGSILAMILTILMVPAAVGLLPIRPKPGPGGPGGLDRVLSWCADLAQGRPVVVSLLGLGLVLASAWGLTGLRLSHNPLSWLPAESGLASQTRALDQAFGGTINLEVVLDAGRDRGLHDPAVLGRLDRLTTAWEGRTIAGVHSGRTFSLSEVVKEINQALHEDRPEAYRIPDNKNLISQELLVFEAAGPDELAGIVDAGHRTARLSIALPWQDAFVYLGFIRTLDEELAALPPGIKASLTGQAALFSTVLESIMSSSIRSYLIALAVIGLIMVWVAGRVRLGLAAMIPNLGPIFMTMGAMGLLGFPFDLEAMLIFSITLGLVVDDTIHLILGFKRNSARGLSTGEAIRQTLLTSGKAVAGTSLVLGLGFLVFGFSSLSGLRNFGLMTALAILLALVADLILAPAMITLLYRNREKSSQRSCDPRPESP